MKWRKPVRLLTLFSLLITLALPAQAQSSNPKELVKSVSDVVLKEILDNKEKLDQGPSFLLNLVETHMLPIIDQERMAKMALGKHWKAIDKEKQQNFIRSI